MEDKEISMNIPINLIGNSRGVKNGGVLRRPYRKLRIKALPANLPDFIEVDITPLKIGDKVNVGDLQNDKYTILHPDNNVVCQVRTSRTAVEDLEDEDEELEEGAEGAEGTTTDTPAAEAPAEAAQE